MSGLFGGGAQSPSSSPVSSLRLQTSTRGRAVPVVYGKTRVSGNLIWYGDFKSTSHEESQGGKGGSPKTTSYTYTAAIIMGICEGAINAIPRVWRQKDLFVGAAVETKTITKQDESHPISGEPFDGQQHTVTLANLPVDGVVRIRVATTADAPLQERDTLTLNTDYTVLGSVVTFTDQYAGYTIWATYDYTVTGFPQDACEQLGLTATNGTYTQSAPGWMVAKHPVEALAYRGLAYVSASGYELGGTPDLQNHSFEVDTQSGYSATIRDANPKDVLVDIASNPHYGFGFPATRFSGLTAFSDYCVANNLFISPAYVDQKAASEIIKTLMTISNSAVVFSDGLLKIVPYGDVSATANGITFTPSLAPAYHLTDDDFLPNGDADPIRATRKSSADAYNSVQVKFYNRAINYNEDIAEASDDANIEVYGLRSMPVLELKEVCDATAANRIAQLILQRALYIRNEYEFKLGWRFVLLEPTDLVTLTDTGLGMYRQLVRITNIDEDDDGELRVIAEEVPSHVLNTTVRPVPPSGGHTPTSNEAPGNALTPVIFEVPLELSENVNGLELWIATGGGNKYGGCEVWASTDNATYKKVAKVTGATRYGTITAELASVPAAGVASQSLPVALVSGGQLLSGTAENMTLLDTLCYVGGEYLAYETATLTAPGAYTLQHLNRGAYHSGCGARASGSPFVRCDDTVAKINLSRDYKGKTIYIKLLAFNMYGGALQSLADVTAYDYLITGQFLSIAPPNVLGFTATGGLFQILLGWSYGDTHFNGSVEIWAGRTTVLASAAKLAEVAYPADTWVHADLDVGDTFHYWIRVRDTSGNYSAWSAMATATTISNPSKILSVLTGSITESQLYAELQSRINLVDGPGTLVGSIKNEIGFLGAKVDTLISGLSQAHGAHGVSNTSIAASILAEAQARGAAITTEQTIRQTAVESLASSITTLTAATGANAAAIQTETTARVNAIASEALARQAVATAFQAGDAATLTSAQSYVVSYSYSKSAVDGAIAASGTSLATAFQAGDAATLVTAHSDVVSYAYSKSGTDGAIATAGNTLKADYTARIAAGLVTAHADVENYSYAKSAVDGAIASIGTTLRAEFNTADSATLNNAQNNAIAYVSNYAYSKADTNGAIASQTSTLSSQVGANTAAIQTQQTVTNGLAAQVFTKIDINGYVTGYGLSASIDKYGNPSSEFLVMAGRFAVGFPGLANQIPFVIGTVNGATVVGVNGTLVVDGTITANKLQVTDLSAITANLGSISVTNANIANLTVGTNKITANAVTEVDNFPLGIAGGSFGTFTVSITSIVLVIARCNYDNNGYGGFYVAGTSMNSTNGVPLAVGVTVVTAATLAPGSYNIYPHFNQPGTELAFAYVLKVKK